MINNDHKKYERRIRHIMCIFLSLETLLFCLFIIRDCIVNWNYGMENYNLGSVLTGLHYHLITPDRILSEYFWIFCIGAIVCTVLSIRFKWLYRIYEGFHCLLGIYGFCEFIGYSLLLAPVYFLILSTRSIIYILLIRKYSNNHE